MGEIKFGSKVKIIACHPGATDFTSQVGLVVGSSRFPDQVMVSLANGHTFPFWLDELEAFKEPYATTE